jgi:hypothetical protein
MLLHILAEDDSSKFVEYFEAGFQLALPLFIFISIFFAIRFHVGCHISKYVTTLLLLRFPSHSSHASGMPLICRHEPRCHPPPPFPYSIIAMRYMKICLLPRRMVARYVATLRDIHAAITGLMLSIHIKNLFSLHRLYMLPALIDRNNTHTSLSSGRQ